jgi:hypothetical protein
LILAVCTSQSHRADMVRLLLESRCISSEHGKENGAWFAKAAHLADIQTLLEERPPLVGPLLRRGTLSGEHLKVPSQNLDDFDSSSAFLGRIADVYEFAGRERTFLRLSSCHNLIYEHRPRHLTNRGPKSQRRLFPQGINKYNRIVENFQQRQLKARRMESLAHKVHKSVSFVVSFAQNL